MLLATWQLFFARAAISFRFMHKEIQLSKGMVALVSAEDFEHLSQFKWYASNESRGTKWYAIRRVTVDGKRTKVRMHREVLGLPRVYDGRVGDHLRGFCSHGHEHTGCGLDNRRCGLEAITQDENMARSHGWKKKPVACSPCL